MCGRYTRDVGWATVHAFSQPLTIAAPAEDPAPAYNIAPTQRAWVLLAGGDDDPAQAVSRELRWGLVPFWARDAKIGYSTINARVETAATKPAFREAWKRRRCLVPASGYYEWPVLAGQKQAWHIRAAHAPMLMFAGLWERWTPPEGDAMESFSIVTQAAAGEVAQLHDRMPLILPPALLHDWLHGDAAAAVAIAASAPVPDLAFHRVAAAVGNVRNQGPGLIEPLADATG
jgi:putative SOS response-associated peptidase YedK